MGKKLDKLAGELFERLSEGPTKGCGAEENAKQDFRQLWSIINSHLKPEQKRKMPARIMEL